MRLPTYCIEHSLAMQGNGSEVMQQNGTMHGEDSVFWTLEYIVLAVYLIVLSIVGILGNIPVLIVYFHKKDQTASNTFIKVLALLDMTVCSLLMPYTIVYELHLVRSDIICRSFEFIRHFIVMSSCLTLVAIGIERYIAVCRLTHRMSVQNVNKGMLCITVISAFIAAPSSFTFAVVSENDVMDVTCSVEHRTVGGNFCHFTYSIMGKTSVLIYQGLLMSCFFVTVILIVIFYIIVYIVLWNRTKLRKRMREKSHEYSVVDQRTSLCDVSKGIEVWNDPKQSSDEKENAHFNAQQIEMNSISEHDSGSVGKNQATSKETKVSKRKKIIHSTSSKKYKDKLRRTVHRRTAKMLFLCTIIYVVTWLPFWFDIFGATHNLILRYLFFVGNATNPIVYGIVNVHIRRSFKKLLCGCNER